jgi:hypothetical protein
MKSRKKKGLSFTDLMAKFEADGLPIDSIIINMLSGNVKNQTVRKRKLLLM